ncbi:Alpha/Beta hydrolase fold [Amanita muscaria]
MFLSGRTMPIVESKRSYAQVTAWEKAVAKGHMLLLPVVILWNLCTRYFRADAREKSIARLIKDVSLRHKTNLSTPQLQYVLSTTDDAYKTWAKENGMAVVEDDLGDDAKLYWLGDKKAKNVILYLHGGAFLFSMVEHSLPFWKYVQEELGKKNCDVRVAILGYSLIPEATFPIPLKQTVLAIQHLLATGFSPQNIQLGGDSAGGALILQLLSHALHPYESVPALKLSAPLRGACLISPCVQVSDIARFPSCKLGKDVLSEATTLRWAQELLDSGLPEGAIPYVQALKAPDSWFQDIGSVVERVFMTTGQFDVLRDQIVEFKAIIEKHHPDFKYVLQENGVHDGPFFDFITEEPEVSQLTLDIVEWYASGF